MSTGHRSTSMPCYVVSFFCPWMCALSKLPLLRGTQTALPAQTELGRWRAWEGKPDPMTSLWPSHITRLHLRRSIFSSQLLFSACPFAWRCNDCPCRTDITTPASNSIDEMPSLLKSKIFHSKDWYWQVNKQLTWFLEWPARKRHLHCCCRFSP